MKTNLLRLMMFCAACLAANSLYAYAFSEENADGKTIYYNILSEADKTCEVTSVYPRYGWSSNDDFTDYVGDIVIPSTANGYTVVSIGKYALSCNKSLTSVTLPNTVTSIEMYAFMGCSALTSVSLPNSLTSIGLWAFETCTSLTQVTIPKSVTSITQNPFGGSTNLTSIVVEKGNPKYNSDNNCNAIIETDTKTLITACKTTVVPNDIKILGDYCFSCCREWTSFVIPSSVTTIKTWAFSFCTGLTSITIPSSVKSIEMYAFYGCSALTSITSYITNVFVTGVNAFGDCKDATLYVPEGTKSAYQMRSDWASITKIEEFSVIPLAISCNDKGTVLINDAFVFTADLDEVDVLKGGSNTFVFTPNKNCQLEQVLLDGLDVTLSVKENILTTRIREDSKMIVTFKRAGSDVNGDGRLDISDVVAIVNEILGQ